MSLDDGGGIPIADYRRKDEGVWWQEMIEILEAAEPDWRKRAVFQRRFWDGKEWGEAQHAAGSLQPRDMAYDYLADVIGPLTEAGIPSEALLSGMDATTIGLMGTVGLSLVAPVQTKRLAADSEAGFESCELTAEDGALKAHVEQFGQMLRVRLESSVRDLRRALAVVVFQEVSTARMSVPVAVERGEGLGKLPASAPGFRRPEREPYTVRVSFVRPPELVKALITYGVL